MFLIQEMNNHLLPSESSYFNYRESIKKFNLDYEIIILNKNHISFLDKDTYTIQDIDHQKKLDSIINKPFIPLGSVQLKEIFKNNKNNIFYNSFLKPEIISHLIPKKLMLNSDIKKGKINELNPIEDKFFLRPVEDNKALNGKIYTKQELNQLKQELESYHNKDLIRNSDFIISPIQDIVSESRFFVINHKIVSYSNYVRNGVVDWSGTVKQDKINFVKHFLLLYPEVGDTYVIDICRLKNNELKIIELNALNASGLYNSNSDSIIKELGKF